jgi:adenine deaminase
MSNKTSYTVARKLQKVKEHTKRIGCKLESPFMVLSFLALPVIPELKLTDKGLFHVTQQKFVKVIKE